MKITETQPFSLRAIVNELIACHTKSGNNSLQVINNIPSDFILFKRLDWLAPLIGDLLSILSHADKGQPVLVSAMKINGGYKLYAANKQSPITPAMNVSQRFNSFL